MTADYVVIPAEMRALASVYSVVSVDFRSAEVKLGRERASVVLNAAQPGFSVAGFDGRFNETIRSLRLIAQQTDDDAREISGAAQAALVADVSGFDWTGTLIDFVAGDLASFWNTTGRDATSIGSLTAGAIRIGRTGVYLASGLDYSKFPVSNTGLIGRNVAKGIERVPKLARYGRWLGSPAATTALRRAGFVGRLFPSAQPGDRGSRDRYGSGLAGR